MSRCSKLGRLSVVCCHCETMYAGSLGMGCILGSTSYLDSINTSHSFEFKQCRGASSGIRMHSLSAYNNFAPERYCYKNVEYSDEVKTGKQIKSTTANQVLSKILYCTMFDRLLREVIFLLKHAQKVFGHWTLPRPTG